MRDLPNRRGLSLIELLVVMAVLAILIGLLLPVLSTVRAAGVSARCQTNLRQMAIAAQAYSTTFDAFPPALRYEREEGRLVQIAWDWKSTLGGHLLGPGPLWSYLDNPGEVQQCPAYRGSANFAGDPFTGYNYNTTYIGGESPFAQVGWDVFRRGIAPHRCHRGDRCAMFGDGGYAGGANKFMRAPMNTVEHSLSTVYAGGQAFRHHDETNVVYLDGHVAASNRAYRGNLATDALLGGTMGHPDNGFLSDDDSAYDPRSP